MFDGFISLSDTASQPVPALAPQHPRKVYEPPTLTRLEECEIEGGATNVPEADDGVLES